VEQCCLINIGHAAKVAAVQVVLEDDLPLVVCILTHTDVLGPTCFIACFGAFLHDNLFFVGGFHVRQNVEHL